MQALARLVAVVVIAEVGVAVGEARADEPAIIVEPSAPAERPQTRWQAGPADLEAGALVQLDAARGGERPGYAIRRARVRFGARLEKLLHLGLRVEAELSPVADEPQGLLDAVIELRLSSRGLPELGCIVLGQMRVPFSAEVLADPEDLVLPERPGGARRLAPGRDVGLAYALRLLRTPDPVTLTLGIFNGEGAGVLGGGAGSMDVLRLSGLAGHPSRARLGGRWGVSLAVNPDTQLPDGRAVALLYGGDVAVHYRELQVGAELVWRTAERGPDAGAAWAWASFDVIPETLAAILRLETLDLGGDALAERALTVGGTFFYLGRRFRLVYQATVPLRPLGPRGVWQAASFLGVL